MVEFQVGGRTYRAGRIDAMTQSHIARRLMPVLPSLKALMPLAGRFKEMGGAAAIATLSEKDISDIADGVEPVAKAIAALSDADYEYVVNRCLAACERQENSGAWARVWSPQARTIMFDDLDMVSMNTIVVLTLRGSFQRFFPAPPSTSEA